MGFFWGIFNFSRCSSEVEPTIKYEEGRSLFENLNIKPNALGIAPSKYYKITDLIGQGSMGSISLAIKKGKTTEGQEQEYAIKTVILSRVSDTFIKELRNEIDVLRSLHHPNIVKAYETYEENIGNISIVMDFCSGGDLYTRQPYSERESARIIEKLLSAIAFMHSKNVSHRDIKFENIMFASTKPTAEIKLIDFGLSKAYLDDQAHFSDFAGTLTTMAPEVFTKNYTNKADLWSIGVICYMLIASRKPFRAKSRTQLAKIIMKCQYSFLPEDWKSKSNQSKDFIKKLLVIDQGKRLSAIEAVSHEWFEVNLSDEQPDESVLQRVGMELDSYKRYGTMKKISMLAIAKMSSSTQLEEMKVVFESYDTEKDGKLTYSEFKNAMLKFNYSKKELNIMFKMLDIDGDGFIEYSEFLAATVQMSSRLSEDRIYECFKKFDTDNSGQISHEELRTILGRDYSEDLVTKLVKEMDSDGDGTISYEEFFKSIQKNNLEKIRASSCDNFPSCP